MTVVAQSSVAQKIIRPNVFRPTGFSPNRLHPVKNNSATNVSFVTLQLYHGLPWFTMVYDGMPTMVHHGLP